MGKSLKITLTKQPLQNTINTLADKFIFELLKPQGFSNLPASQRFMFDAKDIIDLTQQC